jgi:hypothetical protein
MLIRLLVLLLFAMNLGVALWWALKPPPPAPALPALTEPGIPPLQLLAETETTPVEVAAAELVGPPDEEDPLLQRECLQIGPFLTQVDLRRAVNALTPVATRIQFRETRAVLRRGFRVFIASPGSREAALATARELSARGLRDYYVVTAGVEQNTISLGLYRDENNARRRHQEVTALGFPVQLEPRNEDVPNYWIDLELAGEQDWRRTLGGYSGVGSQPIPCS